MSEMIERVTRTIAAVLDTLPAADAPPAHVRQIRAEWVARAAIAAIREPTPDVLRAGYGHLYRLETTLGRDKAENSYRLMIDAALSDV